MKKPPRKQASTPPDTLFSRGTVRAFAIAAPGCAPLIADELRALQIVPTSVEDAGVAFDADAEQLLRANLWSRIASRIIVRMAQFEARDFATLERLAKAVRWRQVMAPDSHVRLRVTCRKSRLYHSDAVAERIARVIQLTVPGATVEQRGVDDDTDSGEAVLVIVRFDHDQCLISVDSSGELLHRRGWRQAIAKAPLRETLAAALLSACEWNGDVPLVDPFCGSGTIGIEAALRARNIAPGLHRRFAMERWHAVTPALVASTREAARAQARDHVGVPIVMSDRDAGACEAARANATRAGVLQDLTIVQRSLSETRLDSIGPNGLVLTNPPYGLRISAGNDLRSLYARVGDVVRAGGRGWRAAMLVPDRRLASQLRLPLHPVLRTTNGGTPVTLEATGYTRK